MRYLVLVVVFGVFGCASSRVIREDKEPFSARDYLKTAYETLLESETDTDGRRVRALLATRAALAVLGTDRCVRERKVTFDGPPTLAVALGLLRHSEQELRQNTLAHNYLQTAMSELGTAIEQARKFEQARK